jgi:hypothetical protein
LMQVVVENDGDKSDGPLKFSLGAGLRIQEFV